MKKILILLILPIILAACASSGNTSSSVASNARADDDYVTGSNISRKHRPAPTAQSDDKSESKGTSTTQ